jgi:ADP-ribose pyrophosphatase
VSPPDRRFERIGGRTVFEGRIISVHVDRFRYADGEEGEREIIRHQGAVGVLAYDDAHVYLVRQPREAVNDPDVLEIPAGRKDKHGEEPLATARRELAEEIGKGADTWEHITDYWSSVGVMDEVVHVYAATDLHDAHADSGETERIETVAWPLSDLDGAIGATHDAKTLIALLWLKTQL